MSMKIVILESAEYDLKELRAYLVKNFSVATWQSSYSQTKTVIRHLQMFPLAGSMPDEFVWYSPFFRPIFQLFKVSY